MKVSGCHMLASAPASAKPSFTARDLSEKTGKVRGISEEMAVIAVVRENVILGFEGADNGDLADLLTKAGVKRTWDVSLMVEPEGPLFCPANKVGKGEDAEPV